MRRLIDAFIERYRAKTEIKYCKHSWRVQSTISKRDEMSQSVSAVEQTMICDKCGLIKFI